MWSCFLCQGVLDRPKGRIHVTDSSLTERGRHGRPRDVGIGQTAKIEMTLDYVSQA